MMGIIHVAISMMTMAPKAKNSKARQHNATLANTISSSNQNIKIAKISNYDDVENYDEG